MSQYKQYAVEKYLLSYFGSRHPQFAQYFEQAYVYIKVPKMQMYYDQCKELLKEIPCDVEWVEKYSDLLTSISRRGNSYYDPIILTQYTIAMPIYQIAMDGGSGLNFTLNPNNTNFNNETSNSPFYNSNNANSRSFQNTIMAFQLLQQLQQAYQSNPSSNLGSIVNT